MITIIKILLLLLPALCMAQLAVPFRDFSGGMVTDFDLVDMQQKYGSSAFNFDVNQAALIPRPGHTLYKNIQLPFPSSFYAFTISNPNYYGDQADSALIEISPSGEIFVVKYQIPDVNGDERCGFVMWPKYESLSSGNDLFEGAWSDAWSVDYGLASNTTGRVDDFKTSGIEDRFVYAGALRMSTGSYIDGDTLFTYPWWYGYIGRYFWQGYRHPVDDFKLYEASMFPPTITDMAITSIAEVSTTLTGTTDGAGLEVGRYWIMVAYEYDGFQYSAPESYSEDWKADITANNKMIRAKISIDSLDIRNRITAVILFTTNPIGDGERNYESNRRRGGGRRGGSIGDPDDWTYTITGVEGVDFAVQQYYFRKRIVIAHTDTSELGWDWKEDSDDGRRFFWYPSAGNLFVDTVYIDLDDMDPMAPNMWDYLGHDSNEIIVLPEHIAMIGDYSLAGDIFVTSESTVVTEGSEINERYRNRVIVSPWGQPDSYPVNNFFEVGASKGSYVTGIREWNGNAMIWTNDAFEIWYIGLFPVRLEKFVGMGCTASRTIQVTPYGLFWCNQQAIYHYSGAGIPKPISTLIESVYDSFAVAINAGGPFNTNLPTMPYSASFYFEDVQQYVIVMDSSLNSRPDTLAAYDWGELRPAEWYGGDQCLAYNIPYQAWTKWDITNHFRQFETAWDGDIYALVKYGGSNNLDIFKFQPGIDATYESSVENFWSSGWTDLGYLGQNKELVGIQLDYEAGFTLNAFEPDTITVTVYADGKVDTYETFNFYATDSTLTPKNWRRVQYVAASAKGDLIDDPGYATPVYFDFHISFNNADWSGLPMAIYTMTPIITLGEMRGFR